MYKIFTHNTAQQTPKHTLVVFGLLVTLLFSSMAFAQRVTTIDAKGTRLTTGNLVNEGTTAPTNPTPIQGDVWFDTTNNLVKTYDGSTWKTVASFDPDDLEDDQKVDVFTLVGNTLSLSLEDDGEATKTVDLSTAGSDDQNLSVTAGAADTSVIDIEDGNDVTIQAGTGLTIAESGSTITLTSTGTDDQKIDTFQINGDNLELSVEDDGEAVKTVALNDIAREPWFGVDDDAGATENTEDVYMSANIGVGTDLNSARVNVKTAADGDTFLNFRNHQDIEMTLRDMPNTKDHADHPVDLQYLGTDRDNFMWELPNARNLIFKIRGNDPTDGVHFVDREGNQSLSVTQDNRVGVNMNNQHPAGVFHVNNSFQVTDTVAAAPTGRFFMLGRQAASGKNPPSVDFRIGTYEASSNSRTRFDIALGHNSYVADVIPMTILSSNRVGINTTDPTVELDVNGNARIRNLGAGAVQSDANGNLSVSSDERLKNITGGFNRGLDAIIGLKPITYKWNKISGLEMKNSYTGFSAQNVQANIPEAVGQDNRGYLTLSDRPITAALVNSVKELKAENDTLKAENEKLKTRLAKIEQALGLEN